MPLMLLTLGGCILAVTVLLAVLAHQALGGLERLWEAFLPTSPRHTEPVLPEKVQPDLPDPTWRLAEVWRQRYR